MSLTCQVARIFAKNPGALQPSDFKLVYSFSSPQKREKDQAEKRRLETIAAKQRWGLFVGAPPPPEILGIKPESEEVVDG